MIVLRDHFNNNPTIIINKRIINGCRRFTIDEIDEICEEYEVPDELKNEVIQLYHEDTNENIWEYIEDEEWEVRVLIAEYGNDDHRTALLRDVNRWVKAAIACYGTDEHRTALLGDKDWRVRALIACYGTDEHRTKLLEAKEWRVKAAIACYGTDEHRTALLGDKEGVVREAAYKYLNEGKKL